MSKVTVVGAGNVGATVANVLAHKDIVKEVVLLDIKGDMARGKALDSWQQAPIDYYSTALKGTEDYADTANSDIVVITAGIPRRPGMSRDDLISTNAKIVTSVTKSIMEHSANPIIIIVSNPLDVMTYAAHKASGLSDKRVFGMAGILDTARYRAFLATELNVSPKDLQAVLMGGHGDTMVPLPRYTTNRIFPCCAKLNGEYGLSDMFLGVPVKLGANGIEAVLELQLNEDETKLLHSSADHVTAVMDVFNKMGVA